MVSSLAAQLAGGASLNASQLADRSKQKFPESYLFSGRDANHHDTEALFALGLNGMAALKSLDPSFSPYEDLLFTEAHKNMDRTLLSKEKNKELGAAIDSLVHLIGPHLLEPSAAKVIEWLVRRFRYVLLCPCACNKPLNGRRRINEFHQETVLNVFLPYHETPQFVKMLSILHIKLVFHIHPYRLLLSFWKRVLPLAVPSLLEGNSEEPTKVGSCKGNDPRFRNRPGHHLPSTPRCYNTHSTSYASCILHGDACRVHSEKLLTWT